MLPSLIPRGQVGGVKKFKIKMKKNLILVVAVIVLAGIAIFTGTKIYQSREEPVAPTQPKGVANECRLILDIPTPSPTPLLTSDCWQICLSDNNCGEGLSCQLVGNQSLCLNLECPEEEDCQCPKLVPTATPTPTESPTQIPTAIPQAESPTSTSSTQTSTATPVPTTTTEMPEAGSFWPTLGVSLGGIILGIIGLLLAF